MKLLVTGGAGFIGSNFIRHWLANHPDDEIVNYDKLTYAGTRESLKDIEASENYKFVWGDICDLFLVQKTLRENSIDTIVHFAAQTHVDRSILASQKSKQAKDVVDLFTESLSEDFVLNNVWGTHVLLEAALKHGVKRFHHVSTDEVFGSLPLGSEEKWSEDACYNPRSPYSASKAAADHLVRAYHSTYGLPITVTNCANNIGPYLFPEKFLSLAITNLLEGKKTSVYAPGNQIREWLWVGDHIRAIELVLQQGKVGETYFVSPDNPELPNLEVIKKVLEIMNLGEDMIELVKDRPGHDQRYAMDSGKIRQMLGWKPEVGIDDALVKLVSWYRENEWWWKPLKEKNKKFYTEQYGNR